MEESKTAREGGQSEKGKLDPCNPQEIIVALVAEATALEEQKARSESKKKQIDEDKTAIQQDAGNLVKWGEEYKKEAANKERDQREYECYLSAQRHMINENLSPPRRRTIEEKINERKAEITACDKTLSDLVLAQKEAQKHLDMAKEDLALKESAYNAVKQTLASITAKLKSLNDIKLLIVAENDKNHLGAVYFLLGELESVLKDLSIPTSTEFHSTLYKTFCEWVDAKKKVREAAWNKNESDADLLAKRTECQNKKQNIQNVLIEQLNAMEPTGCSNSASA